MNQLQYETSPYLLQHAHNPVNWHAWKPEVLAKAKRENKPILVSIGYATCHWCHVMERESFENPDIAAVMNEHFINIKVDREERPDVDAIYMEACQILTGSGGWPLNCFLTPDAKPFYAGTYYPPRPAFNRPSWLQLLQHMANIWENEREKAIEQAQRLTGNIQHNDNALLDNSGLHPAQQEAGSFPAAAFRIFENMEQRFDLEDGGFGGAPKFPSTMAIGYLLQYHQHTGTPTALEHALFSLDRMCKGGIYDQLGGGFARYATDKAWLVPHFEKMLYDNALLVQQLSDALRLLQSDASLSQQHPERIRLYRETIADTLGFIEREMTHPSGVFYAALDADSEGVEGRFYVWDREEIANLLGDDTDLFCDFYGVSAAGNWEHHNILWQAQGPEAFAADRGLDLAPLLEQLKRNREALFATRAKRIRPIRDEKVILAWNALQISAYAAAYTVVQDEGYRAAAVRAADFILENFRRDDLGQGRLGHTWKDGVLQYDAFLDDYAFLIAALIDLYQITFNKAYLTLAGKYTEYILSYFEDSASELFFYTSTSQEDIILRKKDLYDNATPSGNSTMVHNLQRLSVLLYRPEWREKAVRMLQRIMPSLQQYPLSFERWASAILNEGWPLYEIGVVGPGALEKAIALQTLYLPNKVVAASETETDTIPLLAGKACGENALIYLCQDFAWQRPVENMVEFRAMLENQ
ncbi:MAG: thioredoxin domain-containing protein [Lewinellaceae bacterium]|nr:thioredoxin domain-containing protein [Lewinellaceae bacterium]